MKREEEHESKAKVKTGMKERYKQKQETKRDGQKVRETGRQWHTLNLRWLSRRGNLKLFSRQKKARRKRERERERERQGQIESWANGISLFR